MGPNNNYSKHLIEKYQRYPFVYLDVPKIIPDDNFIEIWQERKQIVKRLEPSEAFPYSPEEAIKMKEKIGPGWQNEWDENDANFQGIALLPLTKNDSRWSHCYVDGYSTFPRLMEQIRDYFPIAHLGQVMCWSNRRRLGLHRDGFHQYPGIPSSLRIMLYDTNPGPTFWMQPLDENKAGWGYENTEKDATKMRVLDLSKTPETNSFCFNNHDYLHSADKDQNFWKILGIVTMVWDWKGFEKLIDRSVEKYGHLI